MFKFQSCSVPSKSRTKSLTMPIAQPLQRFQAGLGLMGTIAALGFGFVPAAQANPNPYNACTVDLNNAKLDPASIAAGCAEALHPDLVGTCVSRIVSPTVNPIAATDALDACRRVRRPLELATCVNDIRNSDQNVVSSAAMIDVLDACRRSLLPARFGQCVVGFRNKPMETPIAQGLMTCLDATDYRKDVELRPLSDLVIPYSVTPAPTTPTITPSIPMAPSGAGRDIIPQTY